MASTHTSMRHAILITAYTDFVQLISLVEMFDYVSNTREQALEAENHLMLNMGEHLPDHLRLDASLRIVRIVNHETYWSLVISLSVRQSLTPELGRDINEDAAPVVVLPRKETIEHVLATVGYAA